MSKLPKYNLLVPQSYLQFWMMFQGTIPSTFGTQPLQSIIPMAKLSGNYKPSSVVSKVKQASPKSGFKVDRDFLNIENYKLSLLVPEIRLYRVDGDRYKPFYFPVTTDYNFTKDGNVDFTKPFSSNAAVLKSFNLNYVGNNPFEVGKGMVEADLQIDIDSLSVLFDVPSNAYAQLADLITMRVPDKKRVPNSGKTTEPGALKSGRSLQIAATLGYSYKEQEGIFTPEEKKAIDGTKVFINLFYKGRSLSFQQNGSATISARYHGNLEAANKDFIYNVVEAPTIKKKLVSIRANSSDKPGPKGEAKDIKKEVPNKKGATKKEDKPKAKDERPNHLTSIVGEVSKIFDILNRKKKIYSLASSLPGELKKFQTFNHPIKKTESKTSDPTKAKQIITDTGTRTDFADHTVGAQNPFAIFQDDYISYVTFGDLIDAFAAKVADQDFREMKTIIKKEAGDKTITAEAAASQFLELQESEKFLKNMNILFSDITLTRKGITPPETVVLNAADVPISVDLIYSTIYDDFIKPKKYFFGLKEFLVNFGTKLLTNALAEIPGSDIVKGTTVKVTTATGVSIKGNIKKGKVDIKHLDTTTARSAPKKVSGKVEYIIFHQQRDNTSPAVGTGDKHTDASDGIMHLRTSQDRGLIKTISFSAISVPGLEEYLTVGHGNAHDALRIPHNASVVMHGNSLFLPGQEVYVDPNSFGFGDPREKESAIRKLGIGGYYTILKVSTSFNAGVLSTTLQLQFSSYPETRGEPKTKRTQSMEEARKKAESIQKNSAKLKKGPNE